MNTPEESAVRLAIQVLNSPVSIGQIGLRATECEQRRVLSQAGGPHHCPSYVRCMVGFGTMPVCPVQVMEKLREIKQQAEGVQQS